MPQPRARSPVEPPVQGSRCLQPENTRLLAISLRLICRRTNLLYVFIDPNGNRQSLQLFQTLIRIFSTMEDETG